MALVLTPLGHALVVSGGRSHYLVVGHTPGWLWISVSCFKPASSAQQEHPSTKVAAAWIDCCQTDGNTLASIYLVRHLPAVGWL